MDFLLAENEYPYTLLDWVVRNWAMLSIGITVAVSITIPCVVLTRYVRILLNILSDTLPPLAMGPLDFERIEGQVVRFRSFDGTSLRGMLVTGKHAEGESKGMIVFCHEFLSDMYSCARYCRPLIEAGFDIFSFDFRSHGESSKQSDWQPRQWASDRDIDDVLGAVAYVEDYLESQGQPREIGLFGISRGAGAAIIATSRNPSVCAVVTDGLFSTDLTLEALMKRWAGTFAKVRFVYENHPDGFWKFLRWLLFIFAHRKFNCRYPLVRKYLRIFLPRPILMIHGERDSFIPCEQGRILFERMPGDRKELWVVPKAKHNQAVIVDPAEYARRTVEFFTNTLARRETSHHD